MEERLQKFLAEMGIASRRKSEELIRLGKIKVNGKVVTELGTKVRVGLDKIEYNGKILEKKEEKVYILLNKPIGYVTTVKDQFNRNTVMDLLKGINVRLVPVGRLDMYTSGALLLSNDGDFINKVTHPKNEIEKTYNATVVGKVTEQDIEMLKNGVEICENDKIYTVTIKGIVKQEEVEKLRQGVKIEDYITKPARVKILKTDEEKNQSRLEITIHEGKNRQVRKMCEAINKKVLALHRSKIGEIDVKDLQLGKWRYLTKNEILSLTKE